MPTRLEVEQLRARLRSSDISTTDRFAILKQLAAVIADDNQSTASRELVLRALEKRRQFGDLSEVLDALTRRVGLYPYADPTQLSTRDLLAYEFHRPVSGDDGLVFHRVQAQVYQHLMNGDNVILSAPTSFGKSKIIDAMVALKRFRNIAIVVPTLALIDETRRRLSQFSSDYKLVTHLGQAPSEARNIFVFTAERAVVYDPLPKLDFFVIDEFYKLGLESDGARMVALNTAFYRLFKDGGQFYLLGPNIEAIPTQVPGTLDARWISTDFATVVSESIRVTGSGPPLDRLTDLCRTLTEPTIIYCKTPASVCQAARHLLDAGVGTASPQLNAASAWASTHFHPEWVLPEALLRGIGIHHGRMPRSIAQFVVRAFNDDRIRFLICTSTLIEGVNTKAKNVVIFDNQIAKRKLDFFTFNNIRGRSGRMFQHFVGRVYLFHDPPTESLPFVDFPMITQDAKTPASLLVQMEAADLTPTSSARIGPLLSQSDLPIEVIRKNAGVEPEGQVALAKRIRAEAARLATQLQWRQFPRYDQLRTACELIWEHLEPSSSRAGISSASQLTLKAWRLMQNPSVRQRVDDELTPGPFATDSPDEAVDRVLNFDRTWACFDLPRYLLALSRIQSHVLGSLNLPTGDYSLFAARLEALFRDPILAALEEYGLPIQVAEKLSRKFNSPRDLDTALLRLKSLDPAGAQLDSFEAEMLVQAKAGL